MPISGGIPHPGDSIAMTDNETMSGMLEDPPLSVPGLVGVIVFYVAILAMGLYASWRSKSWKKSDSEDVMLAGRDIGVFVGIFTMTATWVGGGFINGTAEYIFTPYSGLAWTQAPWGYSLSLIIGGVFFAKKMRQAGYVTMLDPFERKYGQVMGAFLYIPALMGETFWSAAILSALGASLSVILGLENNISIIISAAIAVFYTIIGGLYSVAFTDVIQLICIFIGLWLGVGFAFVHPAVSNIGETAMSVFVNGTREPGWVGELAPNDPSVGLWLDSALLLIFGGIPWQVYFQRVLSSRSPNRARALSFVAAGGCLVMSIPSVLIGAIAKSTDWNATEFRRYYPVPIEKNDYKLVLPLVLQYLTPTPVAVIGLGAVSAAVMSSADSSILAAASMFAKNVYQPLRNGCCPTKKPSESEVIWVMRVAVLCVGVLATVLAIVIKSIYGLWFLCSDLVYVILFPQLVCVIYVSYANTYGAVAGYVVAIILRLTGGEPLVSLPPAIRYPNYYDGDVNDPSDNLQYFPYKTMAMLISLITIILVSLVTKVLFEREILPKDADILRCVVNKVEPTSAENSEAPSELDKKSIEGGQGNPAFVSGSMGDLKYITKV